MTESDKKNMKSFTIPLGAIVEMLKPGKKSHFEFAEGIPEDALLVSIYIDILEQNIVILASHSDFGDGEIMYDVPGETISTNG